VTKEDLSRLMVSCAPASVHEHFDRLVIPIHERFRLSLFENNTLAAIRDLLLPQLMSGEISLDEAAEFAEAAQ